MEIPAFSSFDTISVALTNAPKSIPVLGNIYKLGTDIRETSQRVEVNKLECQNLSERIDTLIGFLEERDFSHYSNNALHKAFYRFEQFLQKCLQFINTFVEATNFKRIINNKDYEKRFLDLNRELTQYANDISFGIGLNNLPINKKQENNDRVNIQSDKSNQYRRNSTHQEISERNNDRQSIDIPRRGSSIDATNFSQMNNGAFPRNLQQRPENIFVSGSWKYRYFQYNQWYGPFQQQITFNPMNRTLNGYGQDNVGQYLLNGSFSEETTQIEMKQHYQYGTGNPQLNIGHQDVMQLNWNPLKRIFEGMSYSQAGLTYVPAAIIEMWPA